VTHRWERLGRAATRRVLVVGASLLLAAMPMAVDAQQQPGRTATLTEFAIQLDASTAPAGTVVFNVYNRGLFTHELAVVQSDAAPNALPSVNGVVDETRVPVLRRITLSSGQSSALTTSLTPGKYVLICNRVRSSTTGHYSSGMTIGFEVPATGGAALGNAAPAAAQATAAPKTTATAASPAAPKTGGAGLAGSGTPMLVVLALGALAAGATVGARRLGASKTR
jgi:uncharacterized cupredoxin-like copper-binding protein